MGESRSVILVAGDILLDVLLLPEGEVQGEPIAIRNGGSAANTAAWLASLGIPVTFAGCVGSDAIGALLVADLGAAGVHSAIRRVSDRPSGCLVLEVSSRGERVVRSARGANVDLAPGDILRTAAPTVSAVHLTGYSLLGPHGWTLLEAAAAVARRSGALLSFDPSSTGVIGRFGAGEMLVRLREHGAGLLVPNGAEAAALTGLSDPEDAAAVLAGTLPAVVVKIGPQGAVAGQAGTIRHVPTTPLTPVDTTGAGDAFNAGLLAALAGGSTLDEACAEAHGVARKVIGQYGGRP